MTTHKRPQADETVLNASEKVGKHPHLLTSDDVLAALSEGKITVEECESLMTYIGRVENMVGKDAGPDSKNFNDPFFAAN